MEKKRDLIGPNVTCGLMKSGTLNKNRRDFNFIRPLVKKTIESRERVDVIMKNLDDHTLSECKDYRDTSGDNNFSLKRSELLKKRWFDPKAEVIFEEVKETVDNLKDSNVKAELQNFLSSYCDLRGKEQEICTNDREAVLLELKTDLEKIAKCDHLSDLEYSSEKPDGKGYIAVNIADVIESNVLEGVKKSYDLTEKVSTTLSNLDGLKETRQQMKKAKARMEGLCACLEFRKMKTDARRSELFAQTVKLSDNLTKMKRELSSKSLKLKRGAEFQKIEAEARKKVSECIAAHRNWKMQEILFSNMLEHRHATLKRLKTSIEVHSGKIEKDTYEKKEITIDSEKKLQSQKFLEGLRNTIKQMARVKSQMLEHSMRCRQVLCENMESLDITSGVFEKLDASFRSASSSWSKDREATRTSLTADESELERRLQNTFKRIAAEKSISWASDDKLIRFIAHNGSPEIEIENIITSDTGEFENMGSDLSSSLGELDVLVHRFVAATKGTFMTMFALKKLDTCLGFSFSKLSVLEFDLTNRKTYSDARSDALSTFWHQYLQRHVQKGDQQFTSKSNNIFSRSLSHLASGNSALFVDQHKIKLKSKTRSVFSSKRVVRTDTCSNNDSAADRKHLQNTPADYDFHFPRLGMLSSPRQPPQEFEKIRHREIQTGNNKNYIGELSLEETFMKEQAIREQGALDMARHFQFHDQDFPFSTLDLPIKFLFYTKGIGVFTDYKGRLVDALGLPFPKQRDCPRKSAKVAAITSSASMQLFS